MIMNNVKLFVANCYIRLLSTNRRMPIVIEYPFVSAAFGVATFLPRRPPAQPGKIYIFMSKSPDFRRKLTVNVSCLYVYVHMSILNQVLV